MKENISFVLSVFSSFVIFYNFFKNKTNINIKIIDYTQYTNAHTVQLLVLIENKSSKPISISSISFSLENSKKYYCELIPKIITENHSKKIFTAYFPINLQGFQGYQGYLEFLKCEDILLMQGKTLSFEIYSNHRLISKSVILGRQVGYLPSIQP